MLSSRKSIVSEEEKKSTESPAIAKFDIKQNFRRYPHSMRPAGDDVESLMHLEALTTVGMTDKEIEEMKRKDYEAKRKLGIVFTDKLEKNRAQNTANLIKVTCRH